MSYSCSHGSVKSWQINRKDDSHARARAHEQLMIHVCALSTMMKQTFRHANQSCLLQVAVCEERECIVSIKTFPARVLVDRHNENQQTISEHVTSFKATEPIQRERERARSRRANPFQPSAR